MDVADARSVRDGFAELDRAGTLDIVVNNAGVAGVGRVEDLAEVDWDACCDIQNLKGPFLVAQLAIPRLRSVGGGVIVNVACRAGRAPRRARVLGVEGRTPDVDPLARAGACRGSDPRERGLSRPGRRHGDHGPHLAQAPIQRPPSPLPGEGAAGGRLGRLIDPTEVAALIRFLCSDLAAMITGATIAIDGGKSAAGPA